MFKLLYVLLAVLMFIALVADAVYARSGAGGTYGTVIEGQGWKLFDWISKGLGAIAIASGIAWAAIRRGMGDENALKQGFEIIMAGIVVFASKNIVQMLMEIFG